MSTIPETVPAATVAHAQARSRSTMHQLCMSGVCREKVGHLHGGDILLFVISLVADKAIRKALHGLSPERSWVPLNRTRVMNCLGISLYQYKDGVDALKRTNLVEWEHAGGRAKAFMRLSSEGETWARAEDLLPEQAGVV